MTEDKKPDEESTPQWAVRRIDELFGVIDHQEDDIVELLGPDFNPLDISYQTDLKDLPAHAQILRLLSEREDDEYTYHHDLLGMAMAKQETALQHYEAQLALQQHMVGNKRAAGPVSAGVESDRDVVERLGLKIRDILEKAVSGGLKEEFTTQTMHEHYDRIVDRYLAANRGEVAETFQASDEKSLLERIANVRFDFSMMNIGHAALKIGAVNNKVGHLEEIMRFHAEGLINDSYPVTTARLVTYSFLKEEHDGARLQLNSASELIKSAGQIRWTNKYAPGALNHSL